MLVAGVTLLKRRYLHCLFSDFLFNKIPLETIEDNYTNEPTPLDTVIYSDHSIIIMDSRAYVSGWVIKKV